MQRSQDLPWVPKCCSDCHEGTGVCVGVTGGGVQVPAGLGWRWNLTVVALVLLLAWFT